MAKKRLPHPDPEEEARRERIRATKRAKAQAAYVPIAALSPEEQAQRRAKNNAYLSTWRPHNRGRIKGYRLAKGEDYRQAEIQRWVAYVATHRAQHAAAAARWQRNHPEQVAEYVRRYRHALASADTINDFTAAEWRALCKAMGYRCAYCGKKCAFKDLTRDHITPVSKGGGNTLPNIIPACKSCNSRKWSGDIPTPVQPFLLVEDAAAD